jgi:hypothetical protein
MKKLKTRVAAVGSGSCIAGENAGPNGQLMVTVSEAGGVPFRYIKLPESPALPMSRRVWSTQDEGIEEWVGRFSKASRAPAPVTTSLRSRKWCFPERNVESR